MANIRTTHEVTFQEGHQRWAIQYDAGRQCSDLPCHSGNEAHRQWLRGHSLG
jgi:hypothetical protein